MPTDVSGEGHPDARLMWSPIIGLLSRGSPLKNAMDRGGRLAILHRHAPPGLAEAPRRLAQLAARTAGWSGAELAALCRAAGVEAIKRAVAAAQPPGAVRVQRGDVQIALNARRRRGWGADRRQW